MTRGKVWAWIGLGALVVVNAVLIVMLVRPGSPAEPAEPAAAQEVAPAEGDEAAEAEPEPVEEEAAPAVQPVPTDRLLAVASEREAWRAVVGDCDAPGLLEHTADAGATWAEQPAELAPIARLKANSPTAVFAIGGGDGCAASFRYSADAGESWISVDSELAGSWYLLPDSRAALATEVHGPRGQVPAPCPTGVVGLAGLDNDRAALLCTDGAFHSTGDGGATWTQVGTAAQALALAPAGEGYLVGAVRDSCDGVALLRVTQDGTGLDDEAPSCAPGEVPFPGQLALAAAGTAVWVWSGDSLSVSTDDGATW